jgi:hypothetical protein
MKTEFSACPPPYKVEKIGEHSAKISFAENAIEIEPGRWSADVYDLTTAYTPNIEERIESNYDAWIAHAKDIEPELLPPPTIEERLAKVEIVIDGAPPLAEMIEALTILLEE